MPDWEDILFSLLQSAGIKAYPLVSPLEAGHKGHLVYTQVIDDFFTSYEGDFVDSIIVTLDARSERYKLSRDLLGKALKALKVKGKHKSRFLLEREGYSSDYDTVTHLYRFRTNVYINPYFVPLDKLVDRSFSLSFSRSFA